MGKFNDMLKLADLCTPEISFGKGMEEGDKLAMKAIRELTKATYFQGIANAGMGMAEILAHIDETTKNKK